MKIKATDKARSFRASILAKRYGLKQEEAEAVKYGDKPDLKKDLADKLVADGLAEAVGGAAIIEPPEGGEE